MLARLLLLTPRLFSLTKLADAWAGTHAAQLARCLEPSRR
jgi:hypothetical protein